MADQGRAYLVTEAEFKSYWRRSSTQEAARRRAVSAAVEEALRPVGSEGAGNLSNVPVHPADLGAGDLQRRMFR